MVQCIPPQPYSRQHQHLSNLSYKRRFYLSILKVNNDEQLFATKGMQTEHVWFKTGKNNIWLLWFAYCTLIKHGVGAFAFAKQIYWRWQWSIILLASWNWDYITKFLKLKVLWNTKMMNTFHEIVSNLHLTKYFWWHYGNIWSAASKFGGTVQLKFVTSYNQPFWKWT